MKKNCYSIHCLVKRGQTDPRVQIPHDHYNQIEFLKSMFSVWSFAKRLKFGENFPMGRAGNMAEVLSVNMSINDEFM